MKKTIGAIVAVIGMAVAVMTADGSRHEVLLRCAGVALLAAGAFVGGYFADANEDEDKEDPYIFEMKGADNVEK